MYVANESSTDPSKTSTIGLEEDNGNSFIKITKAAGEYPWFALYNGSGAGKGDLALKFDFYAYSSTSKVRINAYYGSSSDVLATFDFGSLLGPGGVSTGLSYSPETWYNFELYTEKATDSVKLRIKSADSEEWKHKWVTVEGLFDGQEELELTQLRIDTQYSGAYSVGIDNYSHNPNTTETINDPTAREGDFGKFGTYNEPYDFEGSLDYPVTFGQNGTKVYVTNESSTNPSMTSTIGLEEVDGNHFVKITKAANEYPWFALYNGTGAGIGDLALKFDFYAYSSTSKVRINAYYGSSSAVLAIFDFGSLLGPGSASSGIKYSPETWYNFELYTEKATDSVKLRLKSADSTEWQEKWITQKGLFDGKEDVELSQLRIDTQYSGAYSVGIDNYSHNVNTTEKVNKRQESFTRYEITSAFDESSLVSDYVFEANNTNGSAAAITEDPFDAENKVLNLHNAGTEAGGGALWAGTFMGNDGSDTLKMEFDFNDANGAAASEFVRIVIDGTSKQPLVLIFQEGALRISNDRSILVSDADGSNLSYEEDVWYTVSVEANWLTNYLRVGLKEKGAESFTYSTMPLFTEFISVTEAGKKLNQIRIGYISSASDGSDFYIDNYSHTTTDAVAETADVILAIKPKAVKTDGVVTGIASYIATQSGKEEKVNLVVALYDESSSLTKILVGEESTSSTVGNSINVDLTGEIFTTWRAFVWDANKGLSPVDIVESDLW